MFKAKVILDSINPCGNRITTMELTYPRFIHAEIMTHRDRARNAASSRAIPWERFDKSGSLSTKCMKGMILTEPVVPLYWGVEQKGMQSGADLAGEEAEQANKIWLEARDNAVASADKLAKLGIHKSLCNRLTEPFMWITVVMTATRWKNFFRLRNHKDAEKHFQLIARMTQEAIEASKPNELKVGEWHTPYISEEDDVLIKELEYNYHTQGSVRKQNQSLLQKAECYSDMSCLVKTYISAARAARVSYLTHDGKRDIQADLDLFAKLIDRTDDVIHASPLEHVAMAMGEQKASGCFIGWHQLRKDFALEDVIG